MVPPGLSEPSASAASIIERAMRSLIEPPGLAFSSFTNRRHGPVSNPKSSSIGVRPMRSRAEAAGGGRGWAVKVYLGVGRTARLRKRTGMPPVQGFEVDIKLPRRARREILD